MNSLVKGILGDQQIFIGEDLNGHVGKDNDQVHRDYGYSTKNDEGNVILEFAISYDLVIANTYF